MEQKAHKPGDILLCKIKEIRKSFVEVITPNKEKGIVYINETSDYFVKNLNDIFSIDDVVYLTLKEIQKDGTLSFSFKKNRTSFLRTPFEFELRSNESENFKNLFEFTNKEIKKWKK